MPSMPKKMLWTPTTKFSRFTREMYAIVSMSSLLAIPQRTYIDFDLFPKMIRSKMYACLGEFTGCQTVILGSGSGGWVTEAYADKFLLGIPHLKNLVHFSLKYDCTVNILQVLSETCVKTLKILDIEHSRQVRQDSIPYIIKLRNLEKINIFQCDFSTQDQLEVLVGLPNLLHLHRGDFVGDVADELAESDKYDSFRSQVKDFWASEEYYFHSEEQMMNVVKFFPKIEKMLYMFQPLQSSPMSVLGLFQYLNNIDLWGGRFYNDDILTLLSEVGHRLVKLSLVHAEEMDYRAVALITSLCPKVRSLGFHNCEFIEEGINNDESFRSADRFLYFTNKADLRKELLSPLLELKTIKIISACRSDMISWILEPCLNVEQINLGLNTEIDDTCIFNTLAKNRLQKLRRVNVQKCKKVSMKGVTALLENCPLLEYIKDLYYFDAISEEELSFF
ncbi:unnamed protein product [Lepeophtheirus salmonis]|uniref:(salmon louse) hypothetical protein n=1 Tax=Lepeophtheirus salmonis TaxID=72036 RepID=A0A7R8CUR1_LEPSM|nr:unnamed protein product [Lepeophtheirus salmonis]CAF2887094.1 unnamed protein product [Lepeophtheirus salmonis]